MVDEPLCHFNTGVRLVLWKELEKLYERSYRGNSIEPKSRLNQWIHTETHRNRSVDRSIFLIYFIDQKVKYNDIYRSQNSEFYFSYNVSTIVSNEMFGEALEILSRIFYCLRTVKNFSMTVPFMYNFRSWPNHCHMIFWSFILHISLTRLSYFSNKKET